MSVASATFREQMKRSVADSDDLPPPYNSSHLGDLSITPDILSAFRHSLKEYNVEIRFFSGSWESFDLLRSGGRNYNIVLTSETIYRNDTLPSLLDLMWQAVTHNSPVSRESSTDKSSATTQQQKVVSRDALSIVSAKLVYFGVGGGVSEFVDAVEGARVSRCSRVPGTVEVVWRNDIGVKRAIMKVQWE
jgi:protein-histidine N-methyltransferase